MTRSQPDAMTDSTRNQILLLLRRSEKGMSVDELCAALSVTPMAVHRQLAVLEGQRLVYSESERKGRGRPVHRYRLSTTADDLFPKGYSEFLLDLLYEMRARGGMGPVRKLFQQRFRTFVDGYRKKLRTKDFPARLDEVAQALTDRGYLPQREKLNPKKIHLKLYNCPISQVAREFPYLCTCEQSSLTELLDAKVTRDHHILAGQNYCSYIVEKK